MLPQGQAAPAPGSAANAAPFVVLAGYLVVLLVLGIVGWRRRRSGEEDYYLAGREQGWIVSSLTIMATFFSAFAFLGAPGKVYSEGVVFALFALNVPLAGASIWYLGDRIRRVGRRLGYVTPGDMLADYYGSEALRVLTSVTCLLYVVPYVVMQVKAGGLLFDELLGEPLFESIDNFTAGSVLLASITTLYVMIGGMRSVAWTDVIQGLMLVGGMLLGGVVVIAVLGGPRSFCERITELPEAWLTAPGPSGAFPPLMLLSICIFGAIGTMVSPAQWMRFYSARSASTLRRGAVIFAVVLTACFLFGVMLVGLGGHVLYPPTINETGAFVAHPEVGEADQILVTVLHQQLPRVWPTAGTWLASIIVMAIAAASMSTADSNLHALSAILTRDVYDRWLRPQAGPRERTWAGRLVILGAALAALVLVLGAESSPTTDKDLLTRSLDMIADIGFLAISFSMQLLPAALDCLWLRRGTWVGVSLGIVAGHVTTVLAWRMRFGFELGGVDVKVMDGVWGLAVNVAVAVALSRFGSRPSRFEDFKGALNPHRKARPDAPPTASQIA